MSWLLKGTGITAVMTILALLAVLLVSQTSTPVLAEHAGGGDLDYLEKINLTGARDVIVSPDGTHVYAITDEPFSSHRSTVVAYHRNPVTGQLTLVDTVAKPVPAYQWQGRNVNNLNHFNDLVLSPNGKFLYVIAQTHQSVITIAVDHDGDELSYVSRTWVRHNVTQVAITPDGEELWVAGGR